MDTSTLAQRERHALADLLLEVGPDARTVIEEWSAYDLAAHLWVRENDPIALPGVNGGPLARVTEARMARAKQRHPYRELVARVRSGPGRLSWARPMDSAANTLEYLVHHEDLRRGPSASLPPREMTPEDDAEIMQRLAPVASLMLGRAGVRTALVDVGTDHTVEAGRGEWVTVTGRPTELALYVFGRERVAQVEIATPTPTTDAPE